MGWAEAAAGLAAALTSPDTFGELTLLGAAEVWGAWGEVELSDLGQGFVADRCGLDLDAAALAALPRPQRPTRGDRVTRRPHGPDPEQWTVELAVHAPPLWQLTLVRGHRPLPRS